MKKRIKLAQRTLPDYTRGEEIMNMVTHIVGGGLGIFALIVCLLRSDTGTEVIASAVYGSSMIALYAISSIYHGLHPNLGKKVLQVLDHCTIYVLIAGTYTPLALCAIRPMNPTMGWIILALEWGLGAVAITLTAIDLKKYSTFSMICYIGMGWAILPWLGQMYTVLSAAGFWLLLWGGISYTIGAVLYAIGSRVHWMHSVFHIFVVIGSLLQFLCIWLYVL